MRVACGISYKVHNIGMKIITITNARKQLAKLVSAVSDNGDVFAIGRYNRPEALLSMTRILMTSPI